MTAVISRAGFLRGRFNTDADAIRPPWAVNESDFTFSCRRHRTCADACPENIIIKGRSGFPEISFSNGECTFCEACVKACPVGILDPAQQVAAWNLHLSISNACISAKGVVCRICPEKCDASAIRFKRPGALGKPEVDQDICNGCGACIAPCPVNALTLSPVQKNKAA